MFTRTKAIETRIRNPSDPESWWVLIFLEQIDGNRNGDLSMDSLPQNSPTSLHVLEAHTPKIEGIDILRRVPINIELGDSH